MALVILVQNIYVERVRLLFDFLDLPASSRPFPTDIVPPFSSVTHPQRSSTSNALTQLTHSLLGQFGREPIILTVYSWIVGANGVTREKPYHAWGGYSNSHS